MLHSFVPDRGGLFFPASLFPCKYEGLAGETDRARARRGRYPLSLPPSLSLSLYVCLTLHSSSDGIGDIRQLLWLSLRSFRYSLGRQLWASDGSALGTVIAARRFLARLFALGSLLLDERRD
jgi:hypothetical protein